APVRRSARLVDDRDQAGPNRGQRVFLELQLARFLWLEVAQQLAVRRLGPPDRLRHPDVAAVGDGCVRDRLLQRRDVDFALTDAGVDGVRPQRARSGIDALRIGNDAGD